MNRLNPCECNLVTSYVFMWFNPHCLPISWLCWKPVICRTLYRPPHGLPALLDFLRLHSFAALSKQQNTALWQWLCHMWIIKDFFSRKSEAFSLWRNVCIGSVPVQNSGLPVCFLWSAPQSLLSALSCLYQFVTKAVCLLWIEGVKTHSQLTPPIYPQRRTQSRLVWSPPKAIVLKLSVSSSWILTLLLTLMWRKLLTFKEASCYHLFQRRSERWNIKKNQSKQW